MPDRIFEDPRLVAVYDDFDGHRSNLDHYLSLVKELKANSILDLGCGTGCLAIRLSQEGFSVVGLEPAKASLDFARRKPHADRVHWILGDAKNIPQASFDLAVMTGNVAQVFLTDQIWEETLVDIRTVLHRKGHLVFEVRDPAKKAWLEWTPEKTRNQLNAAGIGLVESWCELTDVSGELVSFRWNYVFKSDGTVITSESTLRFREKDAIERTLANAGFSIVDVREAPDRLGKEFVFIAGLL